MMSKVLSSLDLTFCLVWN